MRSLFHAWNRKKLRESDKLETAAEPQIDEKDNKKEKVEE